MAQLTVRELVDMLQSFHPDMLVETEGCDCDGEAGDVIYLNGKVMICRVDTQYTEELVKRISGERKNG